ncbi:MAG TPA: TraR/DksA C4-type zinc finger protein [Planctomycetota bacterium]|nr:TraR/DksA C4-type zinc finger protein [Planctomycetota bacterium]
MNSESSLQKRRGCSPYRVEELNGFRILLGARREDLSRSLEDLSGSARRAIGDALGDLSSHPHHLGDRASDVSEHDLALTFLARVEEELEEIDDALERIDHRSYGVCEDCDTPIPWERLLAIPMARFCVDCRRARES